MEDEKITSKIKSLIQKVLGMKLRYRMALLYLLGGILPLVLIGLYMMHGTNQALKKQAEETEISELNTAKSRLEEMTSTINMVSKYFIFDEKLEEIAGKEYEEYQELVDDYRNYTNFDNYRKYYNDLISWISVYLDNDTIVGNAEFVKVDQEVREERWYQKAVSRGGGTIWQYLPVRTGKYDGLALTRLVRTKKGEKVGVLVIHIRPERMEEIISDREKTMVVLDDQSVLVDSQEKRKTFNKIERYLPDSDGNTYQKVIQVDKKDVLLTCVHVRLQESDDDIQLVSLRSLDEILKGTRNQNRKIVIAFSVSVLISVTMILIFSCSFSERVDRFRRQMQKAASGNFELVETLGGNDEISELYNYLSTMIWRIQKLLSEIYQEKIHAERLKREQRDAEFQMLANQINPHFLYNTLETIRMKARENKQYEIESLVKMLAKILRGNLQAGHNKVSIHSEVELIECYLKIQQYRFGERIHYSIRVDPKVEEFRILPLILQPVVENSIVHGLEEKEGAGNITIVITCSKNQIIVMIEDDGLGMDDVKLEQVRKDIKSRSQDVSHIGLRNVQQRIKLCYGDDYEIDMESKREVGTKVTMILPYERKLNGEEDQQCIK